MTDITATKTGFGNLDEANFYAIVLGSKVELIEIRRGPFEVEEIKRSAICPNKWVQVRQCVASEFNNRLKAEGIRKGKWSSSPTCLSRLFGKELCALFWAIEQDDVTKQEVETALRGWLGLKPEERWWLATMTGAQTGSAKDMGIGWRQALRVALCWSRDQMLEEAA